MDRESDVLERFRVEGKHLAHDDNGLSAADRDRFGRAIAVQALTEVILAQRRQRTSGASKQSHQSKLGRRKAAQEEERPPSEVEYFGACFLAVEVPVYDIVEKKEEQELQQRFRHLQHVLFLLTVVLPSVKPSVLVAEHVRCLGILLSVLKAAKHVSDEQVVGRVDRHCVSSIGYIVSTLFTFGWQKAEAHNLLGKSTAPEVLQSVNLLLQCLSDPRPKIRKKGKGTLTEILKSGEEVTHEGETPTGELPETQNGVRTKKATSKNVLRLEELLCEVCLATFSQVEKSTKLTGTGSLMLDRKLKTRTLHLLNFLEHSIGSMSCKKLPKVVFSLLNLTRMNDHEIMLYSLKALHAAVNGVLRVEGDKDIIDTWKRLIDKSLKFSKQAKEALLQDYQCTNLYCSIQVALLGAYHSSSATEALIRFERFVSLVLSLVTICSADLGKRSAMASSRKLISTLLKSITLALEKVGVSAYAVVVVLDGFEPLLSQDDETILTAVCIGLEKALKGRKAIEKTAEVEEATKVGAAMKRCLKLKQEAETLEKLPSYYKHLDKCLIGGLVYLGPEQFFAQLSLRKERVSEEIDLERQFLIGLLQEALQKTTVNCVPYFINVLVPLARTCEQNYLTSSLPDDSNLRKNFLTQSVQLVSLYPDICENYISNSKQRLSRESSVGNDMRSLLMLAAEELEKPVSAGMERSTIIKAVCIGLRKLIPSHELLASEAEVSTEDQQLCRNIFQLLFNIYMTNVKSHDSEAIKEVIETISALVAVFEEKFVASIFKKVMKSLISETSQLIGLSSEEAEEKKLEINAFASLLSSLIGSLTEKNLDLLFKFVCNLIEEAKEGEEKEQLSHKIGYKLLERLCTLQPLYCASHNTDILELLLQDLNTPSVVAKAEALKCLHSVLASLFTVQEDQWSPKAYHAVDKCLGDIILSTKDSNSKARTWGYKLLKLVTQFHIDNDSMSSFLQKVLAGLAGKTTYLRSATIACLSSIIAGFSVFKTMTSESHPKLFQSIVNICRTVFLFAEGKSREIIKSVLFFAKTVVAKLSIEAADELFDDLVTCLVINGNDSKNRFRSLVKLTFEKLLKKFGEERFERCTQVSKDNRLLRYVIKERNKKKKHRQRPEKDLEASNADHGESSQKNRSTLLGKEELSKMVLDMINNNLGSSDMEEEEDEFNMDFSDDESDVSVIELTESGKLKVSERSENTMDSKQRKERLKRKRNGEPSMEVDDDGSEASVADDDHKSRPSPKKKALRQPPSRQNKQKKVKLKKVALEPYKYIKFDKKMLLNKRKKHEARKQFRGIGKGKGISKRKRNTE